MPQQPPKDDAFPVVPFPPNCKWDGQNAPAHLDNEMVCALCNCLPRPNVVNYQRACDAAVARMRAAGLGVSPTGRGTSLVELLRFLATAPVAAEAGGAS